MASNPGEDPKVFRVFNEIGIIHQLAVARLERVLPMDIKSSQFGLLNHMVRLGDGQTHRQLTSAFQMTKGAMTNNLNRLLQKKLIRMTPDPGDGRVKRFYLTELGRKIRREAIENISADFHHLLSSMDEQEFINALPFLSRLRQVLDENRESRGA